MSAPATPTLNAAMRRVSAAYEQLPGSCRPDIDGPGWCKREDAIDAAYRARDRERFNAAVAEWERFALSAFQEAR